MSPASFDRTHRRALALLAGSMDGWTTRILLLHGIGLDVLADLADAGLVHLEREEVLDSNYATEVTRVRLTEAGRAAVPKP
jgi:hypothetical protein